MINQRYSADAPCTACGRWDCEGCVTGYVLDADGLGLEYVDSSEVDRWYADLARHQYDSAMLDRRLRERRSES